MSLSNFFHDAVGDICVAYDDELCCCLRKFSGVVAELTGESLYNEVIDAELVLAMNEKIQSIDLATVKSIDHELTAEEWLWFQMVWNQHAQQGHYMTSWY